MNEFEKMSKETQEALKSLHKLFPANPEPEDSPWEFLEGLRLEILDLQVQIKSFEDQLGPKVRAALEQLKKDFPEIKLSDDLIGYFLRLTDHLRLKLMDHAAKYQDIIGEIAKIGLKSEQEKQELRCKIQALELAIQLQEAREGDGWKERARKSYLSGDCPTCFRLRGEGHEKHCHWGQVFGNNQDLIEEVVSLREKISRLNQLENRWNNLQTRAVEDLTKALSDSQDKQEHLERRCIELRKVAESERDINLESMAEASELRNKLRFYKGPFNLSNSEYLVVKGEGRGFETQCSTAMANGWRLQGGIAVKSNGELNQAFVR